jgi:hypothetical protein
MFSMKRLICISFSLFLLACSSSTPENKNTSSKKEGIINLPDDTSGQGLSLTIVPSSYAQRMLFESDKNETLDTAVLLSNEGNTENFYVLLTNTSDSSIKIWQDWNSWGYFGLSFEITYQDGTKEIMEQNAMGWNKNFPSYDVLAPLGHHIFEVNFNDTTFRSAIRPINDGYRWKTTLRKKEAPTICKLKAIYKIGEDEMSKMDGVWTGKVESVTSDYIIWH